MIPESRLDMAAARMAVISRPETRREGVDDVVGQNPGLPSLPRPAVPGKTESRRTGPIPRTAARSSDEIDQGIQDGRLGHASGVPNRQEALHRDLVGAASPASTGTGRRAPHPKPSSRTISTATARRPGGPSPGHGHDLRRPARHAPRSEPGHPQRAARQQGKLEHVGPDHRRQSPCRGIGRGDDPHQENGGIEADPVMTERARAGE